MTGDEGLALAGLRVVEAGDGIATAYAAKLLADLGAEVVTVEGPGGRPLRHRSAPPDRDSDEDGALFRFLHTSKRSVSAARTPLAAELTRWADVVVLGPEGARLLPGAPEQWRSARPELTVVTVVDRPGKAGTGPANEFTLQAEAGVLSACRTRGRPPLQAGAGAGQWATGATAALAALAGHAQRARTGAGLELEVSALEVMAVCLLNYPTLYRQLTGAVAASSGDGDCLSVVRCRDGWVGLCIFTAQQWADFAALIGREDVAADDRLNSIGGRVRNRELARSVAQPWLDAHDVDDVVELCAAFRVPCAPIGTGRLVHGMDHLVERGAFVDNPAGFRQPRSPLHLSGSPVRAFAAAPAFDADAAEVEVLVSAADGPTSRWAGDGRASERAGSTGGPSPERARSIDGPTSGWAGGRASSRPGPPALRPLDGLVVLDLTAFWAGPAATHLLATLGADVVKVESHRRPDGMRYASVAPMSDPTWIERSPTFHGTNPGKRSVTIDFSCEAGRELVLRLVERSDVVVENFTPRVMDNAGLGYEVLAARRPGLVMVRMPGFGLTGPWRDRSGFAQTMEQVSGVTWLSGWPDEMPLARSTLDPISGAHAAVAVLAALEHRRRTGEGQLVEVPMVEVALNVTAEQSTTWSATGVELGRQGNRSPWAVPQGVYAVDGEDRWVAVSVELDAQWQALVAVVGPPPAGVAPGDELRSRHGRRAHEDALDRWLADVLDRWDGDELVDRLVAAGVPASPVWHHSLLDEEPTLVEAGTFQVLDHPVTGPVGLPGTGIRAAGLDLSYRSPAPVLGQHTAEVLADLLGLGPADLRELAEAGAIAPLG